MADERENGEARATSSEPDSVLLVHGTGAGSMVDAGNLWWQSGSAVWGALNRGFELSARCGPQVFHWSGRNSEHARRQAADALCDHARHTIS
jgi:hypothetical protein